MPDLNVLTTPEPEPGLSLGFIASTYMKLPSVSSQLALLMMGIHTVKSLYQWATISTVKKDTPNYLDPTQRKHYFTELTPKLEVLSQQVQALVDETDENTNRWATWALEDYQEHFARLKHTKKPTQSMVEEFTQGLEAFAEELQQTQQDVSSDTQANPSEQGGHADAVSTYHANFFAEHSAAMQSNPQHHPVGSTVYK